MSLISQIKIKESALSASSAGEKKKMQIKNLKRGYLMDERKLIQIEEPELRREVTDYLLQFVGEARAQRLQEILSKRTRHVTMVIEDLYQTQNISAVLRTCECCGIQDVHVIEKENEFVIHSAISMGANKWLTLHNYKNAPNNTQQCIADLKRKGYKVVATLPAEESLFLDDLPVDQPTAFLFGTELTGLSQEAIDCADCSVKIPMYGFTESYNISNSVAITAYNFIDKLRKSNVNWQLSSGEKSELYFEWLQKSIKESTFLIDNYLKINKL